MQNVKLASLGKRLVAHLIDRLIMFVFFIVLVFSGIMFFGMLAPLKKDYDNYSESINSPLDILFAFGILGLVGVILLLPFIYDAVLTASSYQATFGKRIMRIKVIREDGGRVNFGDSFLRAIVKYITATMCYLLMMVCMFDKNQQNLHDRAVRTLVIEDE